MQPDLSSVRLGIQVLLRTLHWLPLKAGIQYKIACLCFKCVYQNSMPPYISDLLRPYCPSRTLRSLDTSLQTVPLLRPLGNDLSLFLDPLSETHYHYPSEKHVILQLLKLN